MDALSLVLCSNTALLLEGMEEGNKAAALHHKPNEMRRSDRMPRL